MTRQDMALCRDTQPPLVSQRYQLLMLFLALQLRFYAMAIRESGVQFDVIFGPAYKGIPLATTLAMAWCQLYGENKEICYNRKEVKDHGEVSQAKPRQSKSKQGRSLLSVLLLLSQFPLRSSAPDCSLIRVLWRRSSR